MFHQDQKNYHANKRSALQELEDKKITNETTNLKLHIKEEHEHSREKTERSADASNVVLDAIDTEILAFRALLQIKEPSNKRFMNKLN